MQIWDKGELQEAWSSAEADFQWRPRLRAEAADYRSLEEKGFCWCSGILRIECIVVSIRRLISKYGFWKNERRGLQRVLQLGERTEIFTYAKADYEHNQCHIDIDGSSISALEQGCWHLHHCHIDVQIFPQFPTFWICIGKTHTGWRNDILTCTVTLPLCQS